LSQTLIPREASLDTPQLSDNALDPELSPLHNPILAENLDRWARVYAAAPPEFRTRAIQDLLCDLQAENGAREEFKAPSVSQPIEIACPQCGKIKEPQQKFCGFCGADFQFFQGQFQRPAPASDLDAPAAANPAPSLKPVQSVPFASRELDSLRELSFSTIYGAEESHHNGAKYAFVVLVILVCLGALGFTQWRVQIRATWNRLVAPAATSTPAQANNAPAASPAPSTTQPASASSPASESSSASASGEPTPQNNSAPSQPASSGAPQQGITSADAHDAAPVANSVPASPEPGSAQANADQANSNHANSDQVNSQGANSDQATSYQSAPAKRALRTPITRAARLEPVKAPASAPPLDNGSEELSVAQRYLNGTSGARDPSMAATWLWKAVSKQNPTALVLLSDLYAHGEGVSRNCDQARLLLVAAAKKGAPDAGMKLRNFENRGCR
jgi:TPR repeat protein